MLSQTVTKRLFDYSPSFASSVVYRTTADIVSKAVTLIVMVAAARVLSPSDFGVLALAMTTGWILSVASDAGLPLHLAKQMAQIVSSPERSSALALLGSVMRIRVAFGVVAAIAGMLIGTIFAPSQTTAFVLIVVAQLASAALETLAHGYRGWGRSDIDSALLIVQRTISGAAALAVLWLSPSLLFLSIGLVIPPAMALAVSFRIAAHVFGPPSLASDGARASARSRRSRFAAEADTPHSVPRTPHSAPRIPHSALSFMREVAPVGAGILLSALYFRCDVFFVERWHGLEAVGTYNAAFRIVEALRLFPAAVLAVAFPIFCRATSATPLRRVTVGLAAGGGVLALVLYATSDTILSVVYGPRFVEAALALQILAVTLPLFFVNYALTHQVIAWNHQQSYFAICAVALFTNVTINALLIPSSGMTGAAISTLLTELVVTAGCLGTLRRPTVDSSITTATEPPLQTPGDVEWSRIR